MTIDVHESYIMASLDIVNLFTNVPIEEVKIMLINSIRDNSSLDTIQMECLFEMLNLIIEKTQFKFNGKCYEMDGLPMGNSLSPFLADFFLHTLEVQIHKSQFRDLIIHWCRYVDDIFLIWAGTPDQLQDFVSYINNLHERIRFTIEIEQNDTLNYLDLSLCKADNRILVSVYHKPTSKNIIIPFNSKHHVGHKFAAFYAFFNRMFFLPLDRESFEKEHRHVFELAKEYGYPKKVISRLFDKVKNRRLSSLAYTQDHSLQNERYVSVSFFDEPGLMYKIRKILQRHKCILTFKNANMGGYLMNNHMDKLDILHQSGVYRLKCKDCNAVYIGETGRQLGVRIREHERNTSRSNMGRHLMANQHKLDDTDIKILHKTNKSALQLAWEGYEIERALRDNSHLCLNDRNYATQRPLYYYAL